MCGIAGMLGHSADEATVQRMTELLRHRGPDDGGLWSERRRRPGGNDGWDVVLGHRRLAILDPTPAGHQPMERGDHVLVYNGEIYNFPELRQRYRSELRSECDSEALLLLYRDHGPRCVEHLEGMYAFFVWDRRRRVGFGARDPLGIKPMLLRRLPHGGLAFASEIKALAQAEPPPHALARPEVDLTSVRDVFTYKYVPTPKTIYRGIEKLPPGHLFHWTPGDGTRIERFWSPRTDPAAGDGPASLDEAAEAFAPLFRQVVREHTLSDVPYGVFLSGGIDSSAVTTALCDGRSERDGDGRTRTFTLGFDVRSHDESAIAAEVAAHLGTDHHHRQADGIDLAAALERFPALYDEPFGDHGAWPMHLVARLASEQVKVVLSGEGGDELFGGYHWYRKAPRQRARLHHHLALRWLPALSAASRSAQRRLAHGLERYAMFLGPFTPLQKRDLIHPDLVDATGGWAGGTDHDAWYADLWHFRRNWRRSSACSGPTCTATWSTTC